MPRRGACGGVVVLAEHFGVCHISPEDRIKCSPLLVISKVYKIIAAGRLNAPIAQG